MINLLIFDLDGTLFETGPAIHKTLVEIMNRRGLNELPYDTVRTAMGKGLDYLVHHLNSKELEALGEWEELKSEFHQIYSKIYVNESPPFEGLTDFLDGWQGQLAVASNKMEVYVQGMVDKSVMNQYQWSSVSGGDSFEVKKPHPKQLFHALEKANVEAHEALMIGDGLPDIEAAKAANIRSVAVSFGYDDYSELLEKGAYAHISHYSELQNLINQINQG